MGTEATAVVSQVTGKKGEKEHYVRVLTSCDGHPHHFGLKIHDILASKKMVNGIRLDADIHSISTSASDIAAQLLCSLKQEHPVGTIELLPANQNFFKEYNYYFNYVLDEDVCTDKLQSIIVRTSTGETIFSVENHEPSRMWEEFHEFCVY